MLVDGVEMCVTRTSLEEVVNEVDYGVGGKSLQLDVEAYYGEVWSAD